MFPENRIFSFISMAYPGDTFDVVSFTIDEGLNQFFRMELLLCSKERCIDFDEIIETPANCIVHAQDGNLPAQGFISEFEQLHHSHDLTFYRAVLSPRLWWMTLGSHCQVFLDMTVPQILEHVLLQGGVNAPLFRFKLQHDYPVREMVCQYNESHYHFFLRWLEREGMYYYFTREDNNTVMVITDTIIAHDNVRRHKQVRYAPPTGLRHGMDNEYIYGLICNRKPTADIVRFKDHNYRTPAVDVAGHELVHQNSALESYEYGGHMLSPTEARRLAKVRSEALKANAVRFHGEGTLASLRGGFIFSLSNHYRPDFNRDYLVVSCQHRGNQAKYLAAGVRNELKGLIEEGPLYENSFSAIPAEMQFRPLPSMHPPRISGTVTAAIDAEGSGEYAELDEQGRYKVILPFDLSGRKDGHASCWVRMLQPYGGTGHGMHFPLHKGAEVLLSFEHGDPDRPVIAGAVPNPQQASQVTAADQTMCKLTTSGNNKLHFEDKTGSQRILMSTPTANTWLRMGAPNDPPTTALSAESDHPIIDNVEHNTDGFRIYTEADAYTWIAHNMEIKVGGNTREIIVGGEENVICGYKSELVVGGLSDITLGGIFELCAGAKLELNLAVTREIRPRKLTMFEEHHGIKNLFVEVNENNTRIATTSNTVNDMSYVLSNAQSRLIKTEVAVVNHCFEIMESNKKLTELSQEIANTKNELHQEVVQCHGNAIGYGDTLLKVMSLQFEQYDESIEALQSKVFL